MARGLRPTESRADDFRRARWSHSHGHCHRDAALAKARDLAGDGAVGLAGGADVIRQGLRAGVVDELGISTAPVVLGAGKRLFEGFDLDLDLDVLGTWGSPYATHVRYGIRARIGSPSPAR